MLDSPIFQVIIGMIFAFSLFSILVTQINSIIASVMNLRARHLRNGIDKLVNDPILTAKIITHPLINLIKDKLVLPDQKITAEEAVTITQGAVNAITWISPDSFVNVVTNIIRVDTDQELFGALYNIIDAMPTGEDRRRLRLLTNRVITMGEGLGELRSYIHSMQDDVYREVLTEAFNQIDDEIGKLGLEPNSIIGLKAGLRNIKNPYFRAVMDTILATSETLVEAETQLKNWFNEGMDRASESYKNMMMFISLGIGLLIAIFLNVDALNMARTLWEDPALRTGLATAALEADIPTLSNEVNEAENRSNNDSDTIDEAVDDITQGVADARETVNLILDLRLPVGWRFEPLGQFEENNGVHNVTFSDAGNLWNYIPGNSPFWPSMMFTKIIGILATTIAVAQGAPFWFNLLRRLTGRD